MTIEIIQDDAQVWLEHSPDDAVDLIFGSPPYAEKGKRYGPDQNTWTTYEWADWMADMTVEACRVSRHWVVWVVNSAYKQGEYLPACERLLVTCQDKYGLLCERPVIWQKNSPPNRSNWFVNTWEYVLAFRCGDGKTECFNWNEIGTPPKYKNGGDFQQRDPSGKRRKGGAYPTGKVTRPRDVIKATVGGGHMGSPLAHENEAPFPESLVEPFVKCLCPSGGVVLDPFCGSGTTLAVADRLGRGAIGIDSRKSQVDLSKKRTSPE